VAAIALYMMHYVEHSDESFYHTLNCLDPAFNWFGDNDGYHIEHSLFPNLHPYFLKEAASFVGAPETNLVHENYVIAGVKALFKGRAARPIGRPGVEGVGAAKSPATTAAQRPSETV
jgi:hypothetical protein